MLLALGSYKWVLTRIDTHPGWGFAYLMVDANAQGDLKELEQKILHQFGLVIIISVDQRTYSTAHNVQ